MIGMFYRITKAVRLMLSLLLIYVFLNHAPFPPPPQTWRWQEILTIVLGIPLILLGLLFYLVEEIGDQEFGSYRSGLAFSAFGILILGHLLLRFM